MVIPLPLLSDLCSTFSAAPAVRSPISLRAGTMSLEDVPGPTVSPAESVFHYYSLILWLQLQWYNGSWTTSQQNTLVSIVWSAMLWLFVFLNRDYVGGVCFWLGIFSGTKPSIYKRGVRFTRVGKTELTSAVFSYIVSP